MKDQEGPYLGLNPTVSCSGCKYLKQTLVKSGNNPIYRNDCLYGTAPQPPVKLSFKGNLTEFNNVIEPGDWNGKHLKRLLPLPLLLLIMPLLLLIMPLLLILLLLHFVQIMLLLMLLIPLINITGKQSLKNYLNF